MSGVSFLDLGAALRGHMDQQGESRPPAMAAELLVDAYRRYREGRRNCPFREGELVTPRRDGIYKHAGEPQIVVELREQPPGGGGPTDDMRVALYIGGNVALCWVESFHFERWKPAERSPT